MRSDTKTMRIYPVLIFICILLVMVGGCSEKKQEAGSKKASVVRFGTLPVIQALPVFVAADKGYFKEQDVNVELITFNSAMEKDVAFTSGQIDGYFGDMMTPIVLKANGVPIRIVATNFETGERPMFAIVASPKNKGRKIEELAGEGLAGSSNTILDYLTTKLLERRGIPREKVRMVEIKSIPIRLQMLLDNQVPAAILPEPLVTLTLGRGTTILADDAKAGLSPTILAFNESFLKEYPDSIKAFLTAVDKASAYIDDHPDEVRDIMNRECKIPEPLKKNFAIPRFPRLAVPAEAQVMDVHAWLKMKGIVKEPMQYRQMVADGFLP